MYTKTDQYIKLKSNLPHGTLAKVARKHNVTRAYVSAILKGTNVNESIMFDLIDAAEAHKLLLQEIDRRIKNL